MNANQIINMVVRMVMRRVLRSGVNAGMDAVGKRMSKGKAPAETGQPLDTAETTKRTKQAMRVTRRMGRF